MSRLFVVELLRIEPESRLLRWRVARQESEATLEKTNNVWRNPLGRCYSARWGPIFLPLLIGNYIQREKMMSVIHQIMV